MTTGWAVLVTGSRDWMVSETIERVLNGYVAEIPDRLVVIHGAAKGADALAAEWCVVHEVMCVPMPAQWDRDGNSAGPIRNGKMLNVLDSLRSCGYRVRVEAFSLPQSKVTAHMKLIAAAWGIEVREHGTVAP